MVVAEVDQGVAGGGLLGEAFVGALADAEGAAIDADFDGEGGVGLRCAARDDDVGWGEAAAARTGEGVDVEILAAEVGVLGEFLEAAFVIFGGLVGDDRVGFDQATREEGAGGTGARVDVDGGQGRFEGVGEDAVAEDFGFGLALAEVEEGAPFFRVNVLLFRSYMLVPRMSDGSMSGVSCTRPNSAPISEARVLTSIVLAVPGTPSSRTCPSARSATRS